MALLSVSRFKEYLTQQFRNFSERVNATFARKDESGYMLDVSLDPVTFIMTITLKDIYGVALSTKSIELPIESFISGGHYNKETKKLEITFTDGNTAEIDVESMVGGLVNIDTTIAGLKISDNITKEQLQNALDMKTVATTGSYNDLKDKPNPVLKDTINECTGTKIQLIGPSQQATTTDKSTLYPYTADFGDKAWIGTTGSGGYVGLAPQTSDTKTRLSQNETTSLCHRVAANAGTDKKSFAITSFQPANGNSWRTLLCLEQNDQHGGVYMTCPPIDHGNVTTKITPNDDGYTIVQSGGMIDGSITTTLSKSGSTTTITETCTKNSATVWTRKTTITQGTDGAYTVKDNGIEAGAWAQAAFVINELKEKLKEANT